MLSNWKKKRNPLLKKNNHQNLGNKKKIRENSVKGKKKSVDKEKNRDLLSLQKKKYDLRNKKKISWNYWLLGWRLGGLALYSNDRGSKVPLRKLPIASFQVTQCEDFRIFLPIRFYVKSIWWFKKVKNCPFWGFRLEALNFK